MFESKDDFYDHITHEWLSAELKKRGWNNREFAKKISFAETTTSAWITGRRKISRVHKAMLYWFFVSFADE